MHQHQFLSTVIATVNQIEDRRSATFNSTLRYVQPHATSRSTPRYVIRVNLTFAHDSSLPFTHQFRSPILLSSAHRFCSVPLTDFAHLRSPNLLTSARELSSIQLQTLTYPATNSHVSSNEHSRFQRTLTPAQPLNEHSSFQPQVPHSTRSRRKHNLLLFTLGSV